MTDTERSLSLVVVTAGSSDASSTRLLADRTVEATVEAATERGLKVETSHIDLRPIAGEIMSAMATNVIGEGLSQAISALTEADGLIVGTPVYNAAPSGLFTTFFQAIDDGLLITKPVILSATASSARHALVVDGQMRPMFAYLRALAVPTSIFAASEDWNDPDLTSRIQRAATELVLLMDSGFSQDVKDTSLSRYRLEFGSPSGSDLEVDFETDLMKLAAGGTDISQASDSEIFEAGESPVPRAQRPGGSPRPPT